MSFDGAVTAAIEKSLTGEIPTLSCIRNSGATFRD